MAINITHKQFNLGEIKKHHLIFKNVDVIELSELNDSVSEIIYEHNIGLTEQFIAGNLIWLKPFKKAEKLSFGETNWPLQWIGTEEDSEKISGYFVGISGGTVKTIAADNFINKVVDTSDFRYCLSGELKSGNKSNDIDQQIDLTITELKKALIFAGCEQQHIFRTKLNFQNSESFNTNLTDYLPKESTTIIKALNQHKAMLLGSVELIKPYNDRIGIRLTNEGVLLKLLQNEIFCYTNNTHEIIPNNVENQIDEVLQLINKSIEKYNFEWTQIVRGIALFKNLKDAKVFKAKCKELRIPLSPILIVSTDFYNKNQLFNFEVDFAK